MYLFNVTLTHGGCDLSMTVAANEPAQAVERAERMANRRESTRYQAWRIVRVGMVH